MSNVSSYSTTAASNNSASPNGAPEGMSPAGVNDTIREGMAGIAKWYAGLKGALVTTGSANAYVLSTGSSHASLAVIGLVVFRANFTNTATCTLAVDGLTAKTLRHRGAALVANALIQDDMYAFVYNPTDDAFDMVGSPAAINQLVSGGLTYPTADGSAQQAMITNGSGTLSFANLGSAAIAYSARTSNTILASGDLNKFIDVTSGTFTQTLTAVATLGANWYCWYRNSGTGDVTIDPNASETIDGVTSFVMYPGETRLIHCDGSVFRTIILSTFRRSFAASGTFTKPPGYKTFGGHAWGAGSSGQRTNNVSVLSVGGAGGGCFPFSFPASALGSTETITIGAGGAAVTTVANGNVGGNTSFGTLLTVYGDTNFYRGGAVGLTSALSSSTGAAFGGPTSTTNPVSTIWAGSSASSDASVASSSSLYGGSAGGSVDGVPTLRAAGSSVFGGDGGAASSAGNGTAGSQPGGGGGATQTGTNSGAGADGQVDVWGVI